MYIYSFALNICQKIKVELEDIAVLAVLIKKGYEDGSSRKDVIEKRNGCFYCIAFKKY